MIPTKTALFTGRFQPPTMAHAHTLEKILEQYETVCVGVSDPTIAGTYEAAWEEFVQGSRTRFEGGKAAFTTQEVISLWSGHLACAGLSDRVTCVAIPRPHLTIFNERFPAESYDMVTMAPHTDDSEGDRIRHRLFPKLLPHRFVYVVPDLVLHNSDIRRRIAEGASWGDFLTPGVLKRFEELDGPRRCAA